MNIKVRQDLTLAGIIAALSFIYIYFFLKHINIANALIIVFIPVCLIFSFIKYEISLYLLLILLGISPPVTKFMNFNVSANDISFIIMLLIFFLNYLTKPSFIKHIKLFNFFYLFIFINIVSIIVNGILYGLNNIIPSFLLFFRLWVEPFGYMLIFFHLSFEMRVIKKLLLVILVLGVALSYINTIYLKFFHENLRLMDYRFDGANSLALFFVMMILLVVSFIINYKDKYYTVFLIILLCLYLYTFFQTVSRTGFISLLISIGVISFLWNRKQLFAIIVGLTLFLIFLQLFEIELFQGKYSRLTEINPVKKYKYGTVEDRLLISGFIEHFKYGPAAVMFGRSYHKARELGFMGDDNVYLAIISRAGYPAGIAFIFLIIVMLRYFYSAFKIADERFTKSLLTMAVSIIFTFMIAGLSMNIFYTVRVANIFWPMIGILLRLAYMSLNFEKNIQNENY